jgi:hypothetical protein
MSKSTRISILATLVSVVEGMPMVFVGGFMGGGSIRL